MGYTAADMLNLLTFNYEVPIREISRRTDTPYSWFIYAKQSGSIANNLNRRIAEMFGDDWNSLENLHLYQKRKNIVAKIDGNKIKEIRYKKGLRLIDISNKLKTSPDRLSKIEQGEMGLRSYPEYLRFTEYFGDDLLPESEEKPSKTHSKPKEYITFTNIAKRNSKLSWEFGKKVVY